jgi:hypothetical protein
MIPRSLPRLALVMAVLFFASASASIADDTSLAFTNPDPNGPQETWTTGNSTTVVANIQGGQQPAFIHFRIYNTGSQNVEYMDEYDTIGADQTIYSNPITVPSTGANLAEQCTIEITPVDGSYQPTGPAVTITVLIQPASPPAAAGSYAINFAIPSVESARRSGLGGDPPGLLAVPRVGNGRTRLVMSGFHHAGRGHPGTALS